MSIYPAFMNDPRKEKQKPLSTDLIVQRFFSNPENLNLLYSFLKTSSPRSWRKLQNAFRNFYFEVRFTKYLSSTIKYGYIDFERQRRRREDRSVIIYDMEMCEESNRIFGDEIAIQHNIDQEQSRFEPQILMDAIGNELIYKAFSELTSNQKMILTFTYSCCFLDKEIADRMSISPQAVSKARKSALANLKKRLTGSDRGPRRKEAN